MMNIFIYAMQMEKDGENYYRQLAQSAGNKGVKTIFTMLAEEEVKHFNIVKDVKASITQTVTDTPLLDNAKNIFIQIQQAGEKLSFDVKQTELYKKAQDIEEKSRKFYLEAAQKVGREQKQIFLKLAEEEKKHYFLLENIIQFVSRPEQWLENAEFYHLEDY